MFQIFINNEEIVCESRFTIEEELKNTSSIILNKCYPKSWKGTNKLLTDYYFPKDYTKCKILKNGNLYFCGIVKNSGDMELNPFKPHYCTLQILDYSIFLSESDTLDFVISNKTIPQAISRVIDEISDYGFVVGNIKIKDADSIIGSYSTLDKSPYDVFEYLSEISSSIWFTRMIDENKIAIDFYDKDLLPTIENLEYNEIYFKENGIIDIKYDYSTGDYRNKQIIKSSQTYGNIDYIERVVSNGYNTSFSLTAPIGILKEILVDNQSATFSTKDEKELGFDTDFYYQYNSKDIEINSGIGTFKSGTEIKIKYVPVVKGRQIINNVIENTRINQQLGINGTIARYESRDDILDSNQLNKVAQTYINFYSYPEIKLNIKSSKDFLKIGTKLYFNAPISDLKKEYLVTKKTSLIFQSGEHKKIEYNYELSSNFNLNNELNYFDNQRRKNEGNIDRNSSIDRNIELNTNINIIFKNLNIVELEISNDNVLDSTLNSPLEK